MSAWYSSTWQTLQSFPITGYSNIALLNDEECIVAPFSTPSRKGDGIYRYNINRFRWSLFIKYPTNFTKLSTKHTIAFDRRLNKILIYSFNRTLTIVDVKTQKFEYFEVKDINSNQEILFAKLIVIGSYYHVIMKISLSIIASATYHLLFNSKDNTFECNHCNLPQRFNVCYLKSQQRLLVYGGSEGFYEDKIMEYSFKSSKWNELAKFKLSTIDSAISCVASPNERYMILFGIAQSVYVLDLYDLTLKQSKIKCPMKGKCDAVVMCNYKEKVLFIGYLKETCAEYNIYIPGDLKYLMLSFYQCLYLHLLENSVPNSFTDSCTFWRVGADDIIRELSI